MRPSVTEQLEGLQRILEDVIAPQLHDPYPRDILAGVCATLETLAAGWQHVPAFLDWDAQASRELAEALGGSAPQSTGRDPLDLAQLQADHARSRAALEQAIAARADLGELRPRLAAHFRERGERYPLKTVWRPPAR